MFHPHYTTTVPPFTDFERNHVLPKSLNFFPKKFRSIPSYPTILHHVLQHICHKLLVESFLNSKSCFNPQSCN